jgi:glutathione S-transferase
MGVPYDLVYCDIKRRNGLGLPDPQNAHPEKRVPALSDGAVVVTEQSAIALYLTDSFPTAGLGYLIDSPRRGEYLSWLAFFSGEADPLYNTRMLYGDRLDPMTLRDQSRVVARVEKALEMGPFLMGASLTAADILISGPFGWDPEIARESTLIQNWLRRLQGLPAAKRAAARDAQP